MSSFNQGAPGVASIISASNVFVFGNTSSGNALSVQQLGAGNVVSFSNASGGSNVFVMNNLGRVGVGTTNPQTALDVFTGTMNAASVVASTHYGAIAGANAIAASTLSLTTALPVASGGTGTTSSTGTGSVVLSASPALTGTITGGTFSGTHTGDGSGVTSLNMGNAGSGTLAVARGGTGTTSSTGTGSVVLSASPALSGTATFASITTSGSVGIGTASPLYPLHVNGVGSSPSVSVVYFNGGEGTVLRTYTGAVTASIYVSHGILAAGSICSISDRRSKIPEEPLSDPYLSFVDKINVHQFSWVDKVEKDSGKKIGFFAQEVKDVLPDAVGRTTGVVPTIYRQAEAFTETTVTVTGHGLTTEKKLEIVDLENGKTKIDIVRVIDADILEVKFEKVPKDKIFVIGPEVDDLHAVNHDYLMAVGFGGLKELHALVKTQQTTIDILTERLAALESKLAA